MYEWLVLYIEVFNLLDGNERRKTTKVVEQKNMLL